MSRMAIPIAPRILREEEASGPIGQRAAFLFGQHQEHIFHRTDRMFAWLLVVEWAAAVAAAYWLSPKTWMGSYSKTPFLVWAAIVLGGAISSFPVCLALFRSGRGSTRHIIAIGQMLMSALLIHLTGGRIETHFHVFGSLALLAFYRDWRVLVSASAVVAIYHAVRGTFWPESVFGIATASQWRCFTTPGG